MQNLCNILDAAYYGAIAKVYKQGDGDRRALSLAKVHKVLSITVTLCTCALLRAKRARGVGVPAYINCLKVLYPGAPMTRMYASAAAFLAIAFLRASLPLAIF